MFVKFLVKLDLKFDLKFEISDGKKSGEFQGEDFSNCQESTGNFAIFFGNFVQQKGGAKCFKPLPHSFQHISTPRASWEIPQSEHPPLIIFICVRQGPFARLVLYPPFLSHTPTTAGTFRKKFRQNPERPRKRSQSVS